MRATAATRTATGTVRGCALDKWALAWVVFVLACSKHTPEELPHAEPSPESLGIAADGGKLTASVSVNGRVTSPRAQAIAMDYAARHWPQYHPRLATAVHMGPYWKVFVTFDEPVGSHVIVDAVTGSVVDAGTSNGEH